MGLYYRNEGPAYKNYYHFVGATKYRKEMFYSKEIRDRLKEIIIELVDKTDNVKLHELTIAYNHMHVLVECSVEPSKFANVLFGASSRLIRKEFPILVGMVEKGLWGGKSCTYIKDSMHYSNTKSYISRHLPDNTKLEE